MLKQKIKNRVKFKLLATAVVVATALVGASTFDVLVLADRFEDEIRTLQQQNNNNQQAVDQLAAEANSYQDAVNKLQAQINNLQQAIVANQRQSEDLQRQIEEGERELAHQKEVLGKNIKTMYLEGQISTLEILASSKDLSDYVTKEQYRAAVQNQIKVTIDKINELKQRLQGQKLQVERLIKEQEAQRSQLAEDRAKQASMLAYTEGQKSAYEQQIKANKGRIAELRRQQAIENARLFGGTIGTGVNCGGGYPGNARGPWGNWGCNYPIDYNIDNWGMYNRQCVSYTAFKVASSGRNMPYWGGRGNANLWDDNAIAAGIPVDRNPRPGDVAISNSGYYGHAMYVEYVYEDGRILISQYNAGWDGRYSEAVIWPGNLVFIHF